MDQFPSKKDDTKPSRVTTRSDLTYITRRYSLRIPFNMRIKYGLIRNNIYQEHTEPRLGGFAINLSQGGGFGPRGAGRHTSPWRCDCLGFFINNSRCHGDCCHSGPNGNGFCNPSQKKEGCYERVQC